MNKLTENSTALADYYLRKVGELVNNATVCDATLYEAFKIISGCSQAVANAIYFSSESLSTKKTIVRRILNTMKEKDEKKIVEDIIAAAEKAQAQRNELSHAALGGTIDGKIVRINPRHQEQPQKPISAAYLDSLLKHSGQATAKAQRLLHDLCRKRGIPEPKAS